MYRIQKVILGSTVDGPVSLIYLIVRNVCSNKLAAVTGRVSTVAAKYKVWIH
jgi:hypothetical protein